MKNPDLSGAIVRLFACLCVVAAANVRAADVLNPDQALQQLVAGNARFVAGEPVREHQDAAWRTGLADGQQPFAVVLACADSRVGPELIFDQGLGDVFVIRVAGNVLDNMVLGSIEYAVEHLGSALVVVLGHEKCGAVAATASGGHAPAHIFSIVEAIRPAVEKAKGQSGDALDNAVRANVQLVAERLRASGPIVSTKVSAGTVKVVGARYDLDSGTVEILP